MRFKVTIRGDKAELRGYITTPTEEGLAIAAQAVTPIGLMIASPAADDFDPFAISEPDYPPTPDSSIDIIKGMWESSESPENFLSMMSMLHYNQAVVIRGERGRAERAEKELLARELHHFEIEQENARLKGEAAQ